MTRNICYKQDFRAWIGENAGWWKLISEATKSPRIYVNQIAKVHDCWKNSDILVDRKSPA